MDRNELEERQRKAMDARRRMTRAAADKRYCTKCPPWSKDVVHIIGQGKRCKSHNKPLAPQL